MSRGGARPRVYSSCTVMGPSLSRDENIGLSARSAPWQARCAWPASASASATASAVLSGG